MEVFVLDVVAVKATGEPRPAMANENSYALMAVLFSNET